MNEHLTSSTPLLFKVCNIAYWMALMLWIAAILSAGAAAAGVFATLPRAGIHAEKYAATLGDDPAQHGRLIGGMVMEPIFAATDVVQILAAIVVCMTLMIQTTFYNMRWTSASGMIRSLCIAAAAALLIYHMFNLAPRMNRNLRETWASAEAGDIVAFQQARSAFEADHVVANRLYYARLMLLLSAAAASAAAFTPAVRRSAPLTLS